MTLRDLMGNGAPEVEISGLAYSSRSVSAGTLFFCVPGFTADGHDFAPDAVERGAAALVCERPLGLGVPEVVVADVRAAMGPAAARFYGDPTAALRVVGITGTNGKTTTAFLVRDLLEAAGIQTGLLGTVKQVVGGVEEPVERTTPEAIDLQATFRRMLDAGDRACAMEVSSHALELGRAWGIRFAAKVFTNLTQDHLDFHETMEAYYLAKRRLFDEPGPAVVNADDAFGARLAGELGEVVTFSRSDLGRLPGSRHSASSSSPRMSRSTSPVLGLWCGALRFARGCRGCSTCRTPWLRSPRRLSSASRWRTRPPLSRTLRGCPGRFEPVEEGQPFGVLVDYAHTPDSLENVLRAARELTDGRLHVVFGAGGDRDRGKRPLMGEVAARLADRVIVTSDNPRSEEPAAIVAEILEGTGPVREERSPIADRASTVPRFSVESEVDRRRAIAQVLGSAVAGDVVVIAGKGHEQGQEFEAGRKEPFDDIEVAREALRALAPEQA